MLAERHSLISMRFPGAKDVSLELLTIALPLYVAHPKLCSIRESTVGEVQ